MSGPTTASNHKEPKRYNIPSRDWGITADEAAETLLAAEEIKANKPLIKAALASLKEKKKAINKVV
jgi:hypothetical protein